MNEAITLQNIKEIHCIDFYFNLTRIDQVIGRGIRFCVHKDVFVENNFHPSVKIYKYVASVSGELSVEEKNYEKAEFKYLLIKKTERIMQEEAIDCPLNMNGNIFKDELDKYANCGTKNNPCPAICGYMPCEFKCGNKLLNEKYYDPENKVYKQIEKKNLDYTTYDTQLSQDEISYSKNKIKELFHINHVYNLETILEYVKNSFPDDKKDIFDSFYVYQALNDLIPITENDFNNFHDAVVDKYNRNGYLIYRDKYYIFQPFDENENLPIYYRKNYRPDIKTNLSVRKYVNKLNDYKQTKKKSSKDQYKHGYDFDSVYNYYGTRDEFEYVGIMDKKTIKRYHETENDDNEFKIRERKPKNTINKRATGIPSFKGSVCLTSRKKSDLLKIASVLKIDIDNLGNRDDICNNISLRLYDLEKYSRSQDKNKITYLIVPSNHPTIPFPLNLEDRIKHIIENIRRQSRIIVQPEIITTKVKGKYKDIKYFKYKIVFNKNIDKIKPILESYNAVKEGKNWVINIV